jgi:hypothetical protein
MKDCYFIFLMWLVVFGILRFCHADQEITHITHERVSGFLKDLLTSEKEIELAARKFCGKSDLQNMSVVESTNKLIKTRSKVFDFFLQSFYRIYNIHRKLRGI